MYCARASGQVVDRFFTLRGIKTGSKRSSDRTIETGERATRWPEKGGEMKRLAKLFAATLGFGALGFILSLFPQKTANGVTPTPVDVTNTPLPVKGDVGATILGTPSVKVTSLPPVAVQNPVANGAATPLVTQAADNPALQPFQARQFQASAFPTFTINV